MMELNSLYDGIMGRGIESVKAYKEYVDYHITLLDVIIARQGFIYSEKQKTICKQLLWLRGTMKMRWSS